MAITITEIATLANVSKSTVSRFLNGGYVSKKVKDKLEQIITTNKYSSNFHAKTLKNGASKLIGVIIPRFNSFTAIETLSGINEVLQKVGYKTIVIAKNNVLDSEIEYIRNLSRQGVDGVIISTTHLNQEHYQLANNSPVPIMFWGQKYAGINSLTVDENKIAHEIKSYLAHKKYNSLLYLSVSEEDVELGKIRKQCILNNIGIPAKEICCDFSIESAYHQLKIFWEQNLTHRPDLIIATTDNLALGALKYLQEQSISTPEQIALIGIGGYNISQILHPHLTTVKIDYQQFGKNIAIALLKQLNVSIDVEEKEVCIALLVGETT